MNDPAAFDPRQHRMCPTRWFEDFVVGERFVLPSRSMTDVIFAAFQAASGDNHRPLRRRPARRAAAHAGPRLPGRGTDRGGTGLFAHMVEGRCAVS
jgi:hypothetical protein